VILPKWHTAKDIAWLRDQSETSDKAEKQSPFGLVSAGDKQTTSSFNLIAHLPRQPFKRQQYFM